MVMGPIIFLIHNTDKIKYSEVGVTQPDSETVNEGMGRFVNRGIKHNQRYENETWLKEVAVAN